MQFLFLLVGFVLLIKGADLFVDGASSIAKKFNISAMVIGLTIVAMGTSAPEVSVSLTSSLNGQNDMAVANVIGSNFFNILVVLGVSSLIDILPVQRETIKKDTPFLVLISFILLVFCLDLKITRIEGIILLALFAYFLINTIKSATNSSSESAISIEMQNEDSLIKTLLLSIIGVVGIIIGGDVVVECATSIATSFNMSSNLIGLTILALGTSLPEFVTSIVAIRKGETEIAIGNVIGSNIFNILLVLGISTSINPISISLVALIDVVFMVLITILLYVFMKSENSIVKKHGIIFLGLYLIYMTYTIFR
jgi:cation:H+ antiporter